MVHDRGAVGYCVNSRTTKGMVVAVGMCHGMHAV